MKNKKLLGIAEGGEDRLRQAIEAEVRAKHKRELSADMDVSQRNVVERKIREEIAEEMKRVASPYSLWASELRIRS